MADWKGATFEPLYVRGSSFVLLLSAVPGNRSQGRTFDSALLSPASHFLFLSICTPASRYFSPPPAIFTLLSLLSLHLPPPSPLLSLFSVIFCLSQLLPCLSLLPFFLPHLLHLSLVLFSSPPSPPLQPNSIGVIHISRRVLTVTAVKPVSHCRAETHRH